MEAPQKNGYEKELTQTDMSERNGKWFDIHK